MNILHTLDLKHPTDPTNYVDREFAKGTPVNWRDDVTGTVDAAVMAYLNQSPAGMREHLNKGGLDFRKVGGDSEWEPAPTPKKSVESEVMTASKPKRKRRRQHAPRRMI